jgi:hypothetical protein
MSKKVAIRKVVLHLDSKTVPEKFQFARAIVIAMTGNPYFPNPSPALTKISKDADNLQAAHVSAQSGRKGASARMKVMTKYLHLSLWNLAHYVEHIANADPNNAETIIKSAGMYVKNSFPHKKRELNVIPTGKGEVTLTCPYKRNANYRWEYTTADPSIETEWKLLDEVRQTKLVYKGLVSVTQYHFRQYTIGTKGTLPVSQVISTTVF